MSGLFGLLVVLWGMICLISSWISWDLQDRRMRASFAAKIRGDLASLVGKARELARHFVQSAVVGPGRASRPSQRRPPAAATSIGARDFQAISRESCPSIEG